MHLRDLKQKLKQRGITLFVNKSAKMELFKQVSEINDGARPIDRIIQNNITNPLSENLLAKSGEEFNKVKVNFIKEEFNFKFE